MHPNIARGMLQLGVERLLNGHPLLGGIAASWTRVENDSIGTMGVGFCEERGWLLYYAPDFLRSLTLAQLTGVLLHEVRHIVYDHVFQGPDRFPDHNALIIAQETVVNENMPEELPHGAVVRENYPGLPRNENTEQRYRRLAKRNRKQPPQLPQPNVSGASKKTKGGADCASSRSKKGGSTASTSNAKMSSAKGSGAPTTDATGTDCHGRWQQAKKHEDQARSALADTISSILASGVKPSEYEKVEIEKASSDRGLHPGSGMSLIAESLASKPIPWQLILRRYAGRLIKRQPSLKRPSRRFPKLVGIVPGRTKTPQKPRIMLVVDTSGSMSDRTLAELSVEMLRLSRSHEVWIVECDATIHRYYKMSGPISTFHGRGGTSFCPPFEKKFISKIRPELVVYLTDGFGDAPKSGPAMPVLWLMTTDAEPPASWGRVVRINNYDYD